MTLKLVFPSPRVLLAAGLFLGAAAAQAASGFTVTEDQEMLVGPGMSTAEVRRLSAIPSGISTIAMNRDRHSPTR